MTQTGEENGRKFTYDYVYGVESTQQQVYDEAAFGLVESVLEGYNGKFLLASWLFGLVTDPTWFY